MKLDLDTSDLEIAMEKAEQLKATLEQIKELQAEVALWPMPERTDDFAREVKDSIAQGARITPHRFKL